MASNVDIKRSLARLKEFSQFGAGETFADRMEAFRDSGGSLNDIWPWIPFDPSGKLLCSFLPHPDDCEFENILVQTLEPVRFPQDTKLGYRIGGIQQHIFVIDGMIEIELKGSNKRYYEGDMVSLEKNELVAMHYGKGVFLFKQMPRIAKVDDFSFEYF